MSTFHDALKLAERGFHVFRCAPNTKVPIKDSHWKQEATTNPDVIKSWWVDPDLEVELNYNIGIATEHFKSDAALIVVDIDCKEKDGFASLARLESEGFIFPPTLKQKTPSGGLHLIYWTEKAVKQGTSVLGEGLDIRSRGGYIVGAGSSLNGRKYEFIEGEIQKAPDHLVAFLNERVGAAKKGTKLVLVKEVNQDTAMIQAVDFLFTLETVSSGSRNDAAFRAACVLKDLGCTPTTALNAMHASWKCEPFLDAGELTAAVNSAFTYGKNSPGVLTPEAMFGTPVEPPLAEPEKKHPFETLNESYFYARIGGRSRVCEETEDEDGNFKLDRMHTETFFDALAGESIQIGSRIQPLAKAWFESKSRRSYKGIVFKPTSAPTLGYYNLWRGFTVDPKSRESVSEAAGQAFDFFLAHTLNNICKGDVELNRWLMGYFAHLVQKPMEKPGVAIVLKGLKGTGKNVFIETIGALLGQHAVVVSDRRYLVGNFNSLLENKLLFTLDEAFWSGDKSAEGILKSLVTSDKKMIELKGVDPKESRSLERIVILGNERWLVPASADERRYAVFNVSARQRNDRVFFGAIKNGMTDGGLSLLLDFFQRFDLTGIDVRQAPNTEGLAEQKENSLNSIESWWFQCLKEERIVGHPADICEWPAEIPCAFLENCFRNAKKNEGNREWLPRGSAFGRDFAELTGRPTCQRRVNGQNARIHRFPPIELAQSEWDQRFDIKTKWD